MFLMNMTPLLLLLISLHLLIFLLLLHQNHSTFPPPLFPPFPPFPALKPPPYASPVSSLFSLLLRFLTDQLDSYHGNQYNVTLMVMNNLFEVLPLWCELEHLTFSDIHRFECAGISWQDNSLDDREMGVVRETSTLIPVITCSGMSTEGDQTWCREVQCALYLSEVTTCNPSFQVQSPVITFAAQHSICE